jgi:hypothetical protein
MALCPKEIFSALKKFSLPSRISNCPEQILSALRIFPFPKEIQTALKKFFLP